MTERSATGTATGDGLVELVDAMGGDRFGHELTGYAHRHARADFVAVNLHASDYRLLRRIGELTEIQRTIVDTVDRHETFRFDPNSELVQQLRNPPRRSIVNRVQFEGRANKRYHELLHDRFQLTDRISVIARHDPGWLVSSFYRTTASGPFADDELPQITALGELLNALASKHLDRLAALALGRGTPAAIAGALTLSELKLSGRERDVCAQLLAGRDNAAVAAELGIAPETVRTLRRRLYLKLGVHDIGGLQRTLLDAASSRRNP